MSILDSIKGEKTLSLNHWRFRILHWAFNVENPDPANPELPKFLYTHYCPLFHLTNLIALVSPLILLIKVLVVVLFASAEVLGSIPFEKVFNWFSFDLPERNKVKEPTPITIEDERRSFLAALCGHYNTFEDLWVFYSSKFRFLKEEEAKAVFDEYMPKIIAARERSRQRKERWRQRIIFWTNFSRVFIKWLMNIGYFALVGLLLYAGYAFMGVAWDFICWIGSCIAWLFTDAISFSVLTFFGKIFMWSALVYLVVFLAVKLEVVQRFIDALLKGFNYISPPFYVAAVPFRWIKTGCVNFWEFVSMFYEENCPPIKLVTPEEAIVESVAHEGEEV